MTKDIVPATAEGMPKFNRSEILTKAWADYRRDERMGWGVRRGRFNRKHFAYCLRMVWAVVKERAAKAAANAPKPEPTIKVCANPVRAAEITNELRDMEMSDFINWIRRNDLTAELSRLQA